MIVLHATWADAALHVWGQRASGEQDRSARLLPLTELRACLGDLWDSLLISGAAEASQSLWMPGEGGGARGGTQVVLRPETVPTLRLGPADALDFLTHSPRFQHAEVTIADTLRFWSRAAELVLELLARQRFVPDVHRVDEQIHRGFWRVVIDDADTSQRIAALIAALPPVCRAVADPAAAPQAADLVESFLWRTVDAQVRRCLEGDELAHALHDARADAPVELRWLRSLVSADAVVEGARAECDLLLRRIKDWLARLEPAAPTRGCRVCLRLHPPEAARGEAATPDDAWRLTLHLQALHDPEVLVDAADLWRSGSAEPPVLQRPFDGAREQLRTDLEQAARIFPPLERCLEDPQPTDVTLTLEEAYRFLREAAPALEVEGFVVWLPRWWRQDRPRLGLRLDLQPISTTTIDRPMQLDSLVQYDWQVAVGDQELSADELAELARLKAPLVNLRGAWTEVRAADVQAALKFLERQRSGQMTLMEALRIGHLADESDSGLPVLSLRARGWIEDLLNAPDASAALEQVGPPAGFTGTLRPYQLRALAWLFFMSRYGLGACLADDMGLGKTIELIALLLHERSNGRPPGPTLLVVPMSVVGNWQRELERFGPSLRVMVHHGLDRLAGEAFVEEVARRDVVISTYGLAHRDFEHLCRVEWHRVALDEAQNIKNPAAKQAQAVRALPAQHRVALTGTPVENHLSELWAIFEFLIPGYLGSAAEFRRRFALPVERYHDEEQAGRLKRLIRPFVLRRVKRDPGIQLDLPERMEMKVYCNLTKEQAALYQAVVNEMLAQIDHAEGIQRRGLILAALVKLKQICNHPAHFLGDGSSMPHRSGKCDRLGEMLEEVVAAGDRALVFTQFRVMGDLLQDHLRETLDREVLFLHGGSTAPQRDEMVARFQAADGTSPIFILSLKAGGFGLNLTAANHVFHFDRWWNPAVEQQATDRAHRIGQTRQVQVHKFVCIGTLEERIDAVLEQKRNLAERIIGAGEDWLTELSTDSLRELFMLSQEAVAED